MEQGAVSDSFTGLPCYVSSHSPGESYHRGEESQGCNVRVNPTSKNVNTNYSFVDEENDNQWVHGPKGPTIVRTPVIPTLTGDP